MFHLYGIMLGITLDPINIGQYDFYYQELPLIHVGPVYSVRLSGYDPWDTENITLAYFKQIRSEFHPEAGPFVEENCWNKQRNKESGFKQLPKE